MYVCLCHAITDRDIAAAAEQGAASVDDLHFSLGLGTGCGSCIEQAETILSEHALPGRSMNTIAAEASGVQRYIPSPPA